MNNNIAIQSASLRASTRTIKSHFAAKEFVEELKLQFKKGRWQRYIDELCSALTGRSTFLNEIGKIEQLEACALDPDYKLSDKEWKFLMQSTQNYEWIGDGVLAKLTVGFNDFVRGLEYPVDFDFDDFLLKLREAKKTF
ncbi:hypothetical protein ACHAC9_17225 [Massilia sp. CMS3.1]|uniref:hypothetical protein n=1 Tax=Massilia sp. CMS3.1 TaxID=3373083 RepID=UPI003EE7E221